MACAEDGALSDHGGQVHAVTACQHSLPARCWGPLARCWPEQAARAAMLDNGGMAAHHECGSPSRSCPPTSVPNRTRCLFCSCPCGRGPHELIWWLHAIGLQSWQQEVSSGLLHEPGWLKMLLVCAIAGGSGRARRLGRAADAALPAGDGAGGRAAAVAAAVWHQHGRVLQLRGALSMPAGTLIGLCVG